MLPPAAPDAAHPHLAAALLAAADRIAADSIDQVWLFPARTHGPRESGLAVLAVFVGPPAEPGRTLYTVRYEAQSVKDGVQRTDLVQEEGTVPRDRLDRLVDGVVRRLGGGMETPDVRDLGGDPARWNALLHELATGVDGSKR